MFSLYRASTGMPRVMRMVATFNQRINSSASRALCSQVVAELRQEQIPAKKREVFGLSNTSPEATNSPETSVFQKDQADQYLIPEVHRDPVEESLAYARSHRKLFEILDDNLHVMNPGHLLFCIHQLRNLTLRGQGFVEETNPSFKMLSWKLLDVMSSYDVDHCVRLARIVAHLKLNSSSPLVRGIYEELMERQTELSLPRIFHLHKSLILTEGSAQVNDDFTRTLHDEFARRFELEWDMMDEENRLQALHFVMVGMAREKRDFVIDSTRELLPDAGPEIACELFLGFVFLGPGNVDPQDHKTREVLEQCFVIIAKNMSYYDTKTIRKLMLANTRLDIFRKEFHDAMWSSAPDWDCDEIMRLVHMSLKKDAIYLEHAELLRDLLVIHKEKIANGADHGNLIRCSQVMALLAVHSPDSDSKLEEIGRNLATVLERENSIQEKPTYFLRFMYHLAILGVFPKRELDLLFSEDLQRTVLDMPLPDVFRFLDLEMLLHLHFDGSREYNAMPAMRIKVADNRRQPPAIFTRTLRDALGGKQFVLERYVTPLGVQTDFAVVMREDPVAMQSDQFHPKELPENSRMIAILPGLTGRDFSENTGMARINIMLRQRLLRAEGISSVVIRMSELSELPQEEKIPFIKNKIKEALEED